MTKQNRTNRREFLRTAATAATAFTILPYSLHGIAPSDRIRSAHIGVGGMGNAHVNWFSELPGVTVAALCDVDRRHLRKSAKALRKKHPELKPDLYGDYREVLDQKDIDVISCATPDHWHARVAIAAFEAGKDVYGEKPLSYSAAEGKEMLASLEKHQRIFQLGTQIHAGDNYHRVVEIVRSGVLGKIHTVRVWRNSEPPVFNALETRRPPGRLDWAMWQGPAPKRDYAEQRCHFNFRYFMDYSGGVFADFWCHIADVVFWALEPRGLKSIVARGEQSAGVGDTPKWLEVDYEFADLNILWTTAPPDVEGTAEMGIGAYFEGTEGNLLCDYSNRRIDINGEQLKDLDEVDQSIARSPGHQQNFIDAVKARTQPESNLAYARSMTLPMHLGLISYQLQGRKLKWDADREIILKDEEANKMLARQNNPAWSAA